MGTSNFGYTVEILETFSFIAPKSMLDIGVGYGRYGFLAGEMLDYYGRMSGEHAVRIDGVEIFEGYLRPWHSIIYDHLYIGDAHEIIRREPFYYDMMYAGDVLEHFGKAEAKQFIRDCRKKTGALVIATPYVYYPQDAVRGNEHENHLSGWDVADMRDLGARYIFISGISLICVFTERALPLPPAAEAGDMIGEYYAKNYMLMLQKYLTTGQTEACYEACLKRANEPFAEQFAYASMFALAADAQGDGSNAALYAEKALRIKPESEVCGRIVEKYRGGGIITP